MNIISKLPDLPNSFPPILFVHGAWHSSWCWDIFFMDYFCKKGFSTYALDLSNHGENPKSKSLNQNSFSDYVADVKEAIEEIGENCILIGHSMGGGIIQKYLEKYPSKAAILLATLPSSGVLMTTLKIAKTYPLPFLSANLTSNLHKIVSTPERTQWSFYEKNIDDKDLKLYTDKLQSESYLAFLQMISFRVKNNFHDKIPMLVIGGEKDNIFTVKEQEKTAHKYNADLKIIKDAPHNLMLSSQWQEVADEILNWINRVLS